MPKNPVKKHHALVILLSLVLITIFGGLLILYGPFSGFRVLLVTTAMHTSEHQYLAKLFYSKETIDQIMLENRVIEPTANSAQPPDNSTQPSKVSTGTVYDSRIEKIELAGRTYSGVLIKIANPSRVKALVSEKKEGLMVEEMARQAGATVAINAAGYKNIQQQGIPEGFVISNSETFFYHAGTVHSVIGFDHGNNLVLGKFADSEIDHLNLRDAIEFDGPFLIMNGEPAQIIGNGGGIAPRSAIGQTKDGSVLLVVLDGRQISSIGATLRDVQDIMIEYGAVNAANLDGGSSVSMYYDGQLINSALSDTGHRRIPCCFIVE